MDLRSPSGSLEADASHTETPVLINPYAAGALSCPIQNYAKILKNN